ncbi:M24 family metallopeptidase [Mesorhizobium sp. L-8-3]|uniref:M24 family metallopeptidase n=1 Tax=Mesorhizobium sp. L-8-3 TaxID=2744522 RepID=UPI0019277043|nr:Xaa-Pro peptidase family protein [Mesorhizobium sp. L-8-3]BCH27001.1 ectoine hydrolase DoeA [Mesorhizobium sp. L-8-3]BCH27004.1 ectoine hydrolase DoeA [Mesorhizobium sp. L-8-3]
MLVPAFSQEEYRARTTRLRQQMAERGIDALLVLNEGNMNYLTGYEGFSDYVPQLALVCQDEEDPWLILREMDTLCADASSYLPQSRVLSYPEKYIAASQLTAWQPIAESVRERSPSGRIGVELSGKILGVKGHAALSKSLGTSEFIDADGMIAALKAIKSPAELTYMEQAGKIVDRAMQVGRLAISVGARECDVAATITHALYAGTPEFPGGTSRSPLVTMPVGSPGAAPHLTWTDGQYKMGCQTNFELGAVRHRYCCALSRTVFLGEPNARSRHVHQACLDGFLAAFGAIRAGVTSNDVERAFRREFAPRGVRKESRIGYSIGIDWVDGGPSFQEGDETVLQANMTFHLLIGIFEKTDGYIFSETVRVTDDGAKSLSNMSRDLLVNC